MRGAYAESIDQARIYQSNYCFEAKRRSVGGLDAEVGDDSFGVTTESGSTPACDVNERPSTQGCCKFEKGLETRRHTRPLGKRCGTGPARCASMGGQQSSIAASGSSRFRAPVYRRGARAGQCCPRWRRAGLAMRLHAVRGACAAVGASSLADGLLDLDRALADGLHTAERAELMRALQAQIQSLAVGNLLGSGN